MHTKGISGLESAPSHPQSGVDKPNATRSILHGGNLEKQKFKINGFGGGSNNNSINICRNKGFGL